MDSGDGLDHAVSKDQQECLRLDLFANDRDSATGFPVRSAKTPRGRVQAVCTRFRLDNDLVLTLMQITVVWQESWPGGGGTVPRESLGRPGLESPYAGGDLEGLFRICLGHVAVLIMR